MNKGQWTLAETIVVVVILSVLFLISFEAHILFKAANKVSEVGLKNVLNQIWEGKNKN